MPNTPSPGFLLAAAGMLLPLCGHAADVDVSITSTARKTEIRYVSGGAVYEEELAAGHWLARHWGFDSQPPPGRGELDAFEIRVKTEPSPDSVPGALVSDWRAVSAREMEKTDRGARHVAVQLASAQTPLEVTVHTVLDGTPVLKRWLEITNRAGRPIALTSVFPWAGRLWSGGARNVEVGYATRSDCCWEGWFGWKSLTPGANVIRQENGLAYDHPYFVLRNQEKGEYFFGQLEWPVNRIMEFYKAEGLSFKIGPTAANALRVLDPGETIATPAVHLAHVRGDFDAAVQAMHDHIRRSVLLPPAPARAYRIECLMPEDQPMTVYRGKDLQRIESEKVPRGGLRSGDRALHPGRPDLVYKLRRLAEAATAGVPARSRTTDRLRPRTQYSTSDCMPSRKAAGTATPARMRVLRSVRGRTGPDFPETSGFRTCAGVVLIWRRTATRRPVWRPSDGRPEALRPGSLPSRLQYAAAR